MKMNGPLTPFSIFILFVSLLVTACAKDRYEQYADSIKDGASTFYGHLQAGRVSDAVIENERIEALARKSEAQLLTRAGKLDNNQKAREWVLIKAANETAAENWLALARYFVKKKKYNQARGTYQRVMETYQEKPYQSYAERAKNGLRDLDLILNPSPMS